MKHLVLIAFVAGGCTRSNQFDFTKIDFSQLVDGGTPFGVDLAGYDFSIEEGDADMRLARADLSMPNTTLDLASTDFAGGAGCSVFADSTLSWYVQTGTALGVSGPL